MSAELLLPSVVMAEKSSLHMMMHEPSRFIPRAAAEGVDRECFYLLPRIYDAIIDYHARHKPEAEIDLVMIITELQLSGELDRCGGPSTVADIHSYVNAGNWSEYAAQLREAKARRIAILAADRFKDSDDAADAIAKAKDLYDDLVKAVSSRVRAVNGKTSAVEFFKRWKNDREAEDLPGRRTGFQEIDAISGGMRPGELWTIAGRSSRGKSVLMYQIAVEFLHRAETVAIFSLEMMREAVTGRLVACGGSADYGAITQPKTSTNNDLAAIKRGVELVTGSNVWIDDTAGLNMAEIEGEATRIKDVCGRLDLVVVDYLQIVKGERQRNDNREQEVSRISVALKQLAKKLGCPVITGSQLNADGQTRESRSIEQDSDVLLFIADDGVKIGKMRNGQRNGVIPLFLHGHKQKFLSHPMPNHEQR